MLVDAKLPQWRLGEYEALSPGFAYDCWLADQAATKAGRAQYRPKPRPTPQPTIEAIMYSVRTRGVAALKEPATVERLSRCDQAARDQINQRIAALAQQRVEA